MSLKVVEKGSSTCFAFDAIILIWSGINSGSATVTFRSDSLLSATLAQNIKRCIADWLFGYWVQICKYEVGMVRKLMESFDIDSALLARYSVLDPLSLEVQTGLDDKDDQLESVKADLGIDQGWQADLKQDAGATVDVVGNREAEALAMTLRDRPDDIDNTDHSGPSCRSGFF
jgi:hypothetical protein